METVDKTVTHVIMGTDSNMESPRTEKYIMAVAYTSNLSYVSTYAFDIMFLQAHYGEV